MPCKKEEDEVNIFEEQEDYYQFLKTLDMMALSYEPDGETGISSVSGLRVNL